MERRKITIGAWLNKLEKIFTVKTHWRPHLDEVFAIVLIALFADFYFVNRYGSRERQFSIGVDGGCFDEHDQRGRAPDQDECASKLVWGILGIKSRHLFWINRLVEKVRRWDRNPNNQLRSNLGNLLKAAYHPDDSEDLQIQYVRWAMFGIKAFIWAGTDQGGPFLSDRRWDKIRVDFREQLDDKYSSVAVDTLLEDKRAAEDPLSVRAIAEALWLQTGSRQKVYEWMEMAVEIVWLNEMIRQDARKLVAEAQIVEIQSRATGVSVRVVSIVSDNPTLHNAVGLGRTTTRRKAEILVQQRSDGSTQIHQQHNTVDMGRVACRIRVAELRKRGQATNSNLEGYRVDGVHPRISEWFLFGSDKGLYNRTLTNPDMPVTQLSLEEVMQCVIQELTGEPLVLQEAAA